MSLADEHELVVAEDGSIPADELRRLGVRPGAHVRVVATSAPIIRRGSLAGSLPELSDVPWEDFERASEAARRDADAACG